MAFEYVVVIIMIYSGSGGSGGGGVLYAHGRKHESVIDQMRTTRKQEKRSMALKYSLLSFLSFHFVFLVLLEEEEEEERGVLLRITGANA